jgi:hypothetical protein
MPRSFAILAVLITAACNSSPTTPLLASDEGRPSESSKERTAATLPLQTRAGALKKGQPLLKENRQRPAIELLAPVKQQDIVAVTLLSPRSLSLKLRLKGGRFRVFKPMLKQNRRARYEVAAFRIAEHLAVKQVPAARIGRIPLEFLTSRLKIDAETSAEKLTESALLTGEGSVLGAEIEWISDLDPKGIEQLGGISAMKKWLQPGRPAGTLEPILSRSFSIMVCFDYLIGNWDRFSGGNLFVNRAADALVLLDHNGSFARWGETSRKRMNRLLKSSERFSKGFIERLRTLEASDIEAALSREPDHSRHPLLTEREKTLILERRDALLAYIDALVFNKGAENIIVFD